LVELQRDEQRLSSATAARGRRINGSHSAACSQNGGWYFIDDQCTATTMPPIMMTKTGPVAASMKHDRSEDSQLGAASETA